MAVAELLHLNAAKGIDNCDSLHRTAVFIAALHGNTDCLQLLIAAGADINKPNKHSQSPLMAASEKGWVACVEMLLKAGADPFHLDKKSKSAVSVAKGENIKSLIAASLSGSSGNT